MLSINLLNTLRNRPRFIFETKLNKEEFTSILSSHFELNNKKIGGYVSKEQAVFRVRASKNEYWAPQLQVRAEYDEHDDITIIRGIFGPKPGIWTLFVLTYAICGFAAFFSAIMYISYQSFNQGNIFLVSIFISVLGIIMLFVFSKIGQFKSEEEMMVLRNFIIDVLEQEAIIHVEESKNK